MEMIRDYANDSLDIWADFVGRGRNNTNGYDVLLSTQKSEGKSKRITVTFYGKARDLVSGFARVKVSSLQKVPNKMYFGLYATDDARYGYSIPSDSEKSIRISATVPIAEVEKVESKHKGYYDLKFDDEYQLYYINLNERKK